MFGADFGEFADAIRIYTTGKTSFRNQLTNVYRIARDVISRNYTSGTPALVEPWYGLAATQFYTDLNKYYLDKYIR